MMYWCGANEIPQIISWNKGRDNVTNENIQQQAVEDSMVLEAAKKYAKAKGVRQGLGKDARANSVVCFRTDNIVPLPCEEEEQDNVAYLWAAGLREPSLLDNLPSWRN